MASMWLSGVKRVDLSGSHGDGPFKLPVLGVVMHVNESNGNLANFFHNSTSVCPNFQVYKSGAIEQYLPINWRPWCQMDGDAQYGAIETEGYTTEPWTAAQLTSIANLVRQYHDLLGVPLQLANAPGQHGIGTHAMGGNAWGGHPCPGSMRTSQRQVVLNILKPPPPPTPPPPPPPVEEDDMVYGWIYPNVDSATHLIAVDLMSKVAITPADAARLKAARDFDANSMYGTGLALDAATAAAIPLVASFEVAQLEAVEVQGSEAVEGLLTQILAALQQNPLPSSS